jgi:hypothetical protein
MPESDPATIPRQFRQPQPALIKAAAQIVAANPGAAERILTSHYATTTGHCATATGHCAGCDQTTPTWWPCTPVNIAWVARIISAGRTDDSPSIRDVFHDR